MGPDYQKWVKNGSKMGPDYQKRILAEIDPHNPKCFQKIRLHLFYMSHEFSDSNCNEAGIGKISIF